MDDYKKALIHHLGPGGIKCYCCNSKARKHGGRNKNRGHSGVARSRLKQLLYKILRKEITQ